MKKITLIAVILSLSASVGFAQSDDGQLRSGSIYSRLGIGIPIDMANTAAGSAGVLGVSYNEVYVPSLANPAHWGNTVYGLGSGGVSIKSYHATEGENSVTNSAFSVDQFQLQLPIIRGRLGVSGSFSPVTESSYRTFREDSRIIGEGGVQDTLRYGIENQGSGGVNRAEIGMGWRITPNISVGYAASLLFASHDDSYNGYFGDSSYESVSYTLQTSGNGFGHRFGTFIEIPELFNDDDELGIGASVSLPVSLTAERKEIAGAGGPQPIEITEAPYLGDGEIQMPMEVSAGLSYQPSSLMLISGEGLYQEWSNYENDFKSSEESLYKDRYKAGVGVQYFPYVTGSDKFLSQLKYRLGTSYDTGHLKLDGEQINTLMFSLGLGIRSPKSNSTIDLSFEYGLRGTSSESLIQEQIWGVSLSLNLAEIMFFRPRLQ